MIPRTPIRRPGADEYAPYYGQYVSVVPGDDVMAVLERQEVARLLAGLGEPKGGHRYAPGKWSVKEIVGHLADTERIMAYRALRIARGDETPLPGFEQDDYVRAAGFDERSLEELLDEFEAVRRATVTLFRSLASMTHGRRGTANGVPVSVRALAYIIAGHERHHAKVLETRYLMSA